jgi:adenine deaminase
MESSLSQAAPRRGTYKTSVSGGNFKTTNESSQPSKSKSDNLIKNIASISKMLFTNAAIITVNSAREIILNGALLVRDTRIADIGKTDALLTKYPDEDIYDLLGHIVIPGLISTHMHTAQTLLR